MGNFRILEDSDFEKTISGISEFGVLEEKGFWSQKLNV